MKVAVIGAGLGGMAAAYDLVRAGHEVTIYEADNFAGGLAGGFKESHWDWTVERFYHHWFQSDHSLLKWIDELGWRSKVHFFRPLSVMYHKDKFYPFDSILNALLYPGLGWGINKIRFGLVGLYLRLTNNWHPLEKVTTHEWMQKWAGSSYHTMWEPMLEGKFGPYYKDINMAWMWARIKTRTTNLGTFEGGFQVFADSLAEHLRSLGVKIHFSTPVERILTNENQSIGLIVGNKQIDFDRCLVTTSPGLLAHLAPDLPPDYLQGLLQLKHLGAVVMVIALKRRLSEQGYYWFNLPKSAGFPFLALVEHTNFIPTEHFGGDHILYCGDYLPAGHEYFSLSQEELLTRFTPGLARINPDFQPDWVRKIWLFRTSYAQPVPLVNHSQHIPPIKTPMPGLFFASMSQVYPWDRGTNFAVELGRKAAALLLSEG
jgi:protoporphyrinogen oxidase